MNQTNCRRCGAPCVGEGSGNKAARVFKRSREGVCVHCGVIQVLQMLDNMHGNRLLPPGSSWPRVLRLPHVQRQFENVLRAAHADAMPDEINWERVADLWDAAPPSTGKLF